MARAELRRALAWWVGALAVNPVMDVAAAPSQEAFAAAGPLRVEVVLVGAAERDPALFERIRSLFARGALVVLRPENGLVSRAVLKPERADTLYIWVRSRSRTSARVYLAMREESEQSARYLYRDVTLESGLDEVGSESLAQVAHSAAEALWSREQQVSKLELSRALARESELLPPSPPQPMRVNPVSSRTSEPAEAAPKAPSSPAAPFRIGLGASFATHGGGDEGFLSEPGVFVRAGYGAFSLRLGANYLMPAEFELLPARVRLSGGSGEFRAGWLPLTGRRGRVRLEAGLGAWAGRWTAMIVTDDPRAHPNSASFLRPYGLAAGAFEWSFGSGWIAARAELRARFKRTEYEISGAANSASSSYLNPGAALELGVVLDPGVQ